MPEKAIIRSLDSQLVVARAHANHERAEKVRALSYLKSILVAYRDPEKEAMDLVKALDAAEKEGYGPDLCGICGMILEPEWVAHQKKERGYVLYCSFCLARERDEEDEDE
jgi:hypothetical protein